MDLGGGRAKHQEDALRRMHEEDALVHAVPGIPAADTPDGQAVQDFMYVLDRHRSECEALGKYDEAELARSRLEQLQQHEENRRRAELRSDQLAERLGVEEAHMRELQEFNEL